MFRLLTALLMMALTLAGQALAQSTEAWNIEFPKGDFSQTSVPYDELVYDGNTRDSIPPIYQPSYEPIAKSTRYSDFEPVISININGDARAYPLQIMLWNEMVNDVIGGEPLLITYCPLCNSGVVFSRVLGGETLLFGNTGRIRRIDMVMFDHQSESWWQQFTGEAIMGTRLGETLTPVPSRIESVDLFRKREPEGQILVPNDPSDRPYGLSPFSNLDTGRAPRVYSTWPLPDGIKPTQYVVVANGRAWPLSRIREAGSFTEEDLLFGWTAGRNSLHDTPVISQGRDLGNVTVQNADGSDAVYDLVFAFTFAAFMPDGEWMLGK